MHDSAKLIISILKELEEKHEAIIGDTDSSNDEYANGYRAGHVDGQQEAIGELISSLGKRL